MERPPKIGTDHTPIMLALSTNLIKIKVTVEDNYNLAHWQIFQTYISKWEQIELDRKNTQEIDNTTRKLIQNLKEAKKSSISDKIQNQQPYQ